MASTEIEICNLALARVRASEIGALDEQSVESSKCNIFYPIARRSVLSSYPWTFAKKTQALSLSTSQLAEWTYCYNFPSDCLKAVYIVPPNSNGPVTAGGSQLGRVEYNPIEFEILTVDGLKVIGCNYPEAVLAYGADITDVRLFDPLFEDMLAWRLAQELALPLGGDSGASYRSEAMREYRMILDEAVCMDQNQNSPNKVLQMPREIKARTGAVNQWWSYNSLFYRR